MTSNAIDRSNDVFAGLIARETEAWAVTIRSATSIRLDWTARTGELKRMKAEPWFDFQSLPLVQALRGRREVLRAPDYP